jgi:hypothetical protein
MTPSKLIILAVCLCALIATPTASAAVQRPFSPNSFWNKPLASDAPIDANSKTYVDGLAWEAWAWGTWINTSQYSTPVYTVTPGQATVHVTLDKYDPGLQAAFDRVPIPANAQPAAGTDGHMVIWQPATDTMWEFWRAVKLADGWHAPYGGRMRNVSTNPGHFTDPPGWGATATSLPLLGGLMRTEEVRQGHIDHALALAIPQAASKVYSWPAQRTDGNVDSPNAIPEGTRFRLDPKLNLASIPMSPMTRMMAVAAQKYGIVVRDIAGSVTFFGEDPTPTGSDPWGTFFGQKYPSALLAEFPWASLQALKTDLKSQP